MPAFSSCSPPPLNSLTTVSTATKTQTLTLTRNRIQTRTRSISQSDPLRYCSCGRRHLLAASLLPSILPSNSQAAEITSSPSHIPTSVIDKFYPPKADWYEEFYAQATDMGMISYEAEIAGYKKELFGRLAVSGKSKNIVELGVGTGANFKYYASAADFNVIGVDPNKKMGKHARAAAVAAGLPPTNFTFIRGVLSSIHNKGTRSYMSFPPFILLLQELMFADAPTKRLKLYSVPNIISFKQVGEALPIGDNSMDAVIGTLVLCSVKDVDISLKEVRRVLKPGGIYLFIEHVAASDGSLLRFMQNFLDPLQQFVADGCHLTRETGRHISEVGFSSVNLNSTFLSRTSLISPHIYGIACK